MNILFENESKKIELTLKQIYGISNTNAEKLYSKFGLNKNVKFNQIPTYLKSNLNFLKLIESNFKFIIGPELKHLEKNNLKKLQLTKSYRAVRHKQCLPVRGQRTKTNARTQKNKLSNRLQLLKKK